MRKCSGNRTTIPIIKLLNSIRKFYPTQDIEIYAGKGCFFGVVRAAALPIIAPPYGNT